MFVDGGMYCVECDEPIMDGVCCNLSLHDYNSISNTVYLHTGECLKEFNSFLKSNTVVYELEEVCNFLVQMEEKP